MAIELTLDQKGAASLTLGRLVEQTRDNFPDPRYRPKVYKDTPEYHLYSIDPYPYQIWVTADGVGTKPELAERLAEDYSQTEFFENLAFDTFAMVESDEARWGRFPLGIANIIDTNCATPEVIAALSRGAKRACDEGGFALFNGETAELGYRVSGYGRTRVSWNAVGISLVVPNKLILGDGLKAGQPIVALQETSIRSNGLTKAREILEKDYLRVLGTTSKEEYFMERLKEYFGDMLPPDHQQTVNFFNNIFGHPFLEQVLIPWHQLEPSIVRELLRPSTLYARLIYQAQGGVDNPREIDMVAAAHISGGGIPEKVKRMLAPMELGAHIDPVFSDPRGISRLLEIAKNLPNEGQDIINDRKACEEWNRGIGFVIVTKTDDDARRLVNLAREWNYQAAVAGRVLDVPKIEFRGHTWTY